MMTISQSKSLIRTLICALLLLSAFPACDRSETEPFEPVEYDKFSGLLFSKAVSLEDFVTQALRQIGMPSLEAFLRKQGFQESEIRAAESKIRLYLRMAGQYDVHGITYHTHNPKGEPVVASGVLYYPKSRDPKGVIEVVPWIKSKAECGTANYYLLEVVPGLTGYAYIVPDQLGVGSTSDWPINYIQYENVAQVSADMRQAVSEFVHNHYHSTLDGNTFLFGYSLGGGGALALARHYGKHPERGVTVKGLFLGGGAYYPELVAESQLRSRRSDFPVLPNIICSWNYYEDLQWDFSEVFKGELLKHYKEWCYGQYSIGQLSSKLGNDLEAYFTEDFLNESESPKYRQVLEICRQKQVPEDWEASCPIHLYHGKADTTVPISCSDRLYEALRGRGADVSYKQYETGHEESVLLMLADFWKFLNGN